MGRWSLQTLRRNMRWDMDMDALIGRIGMQDGWRITCMLDVRWHSAQRGRCRV